MRAVHRRQGVSRPGPVLRDHEVSDPSAGLALASGVVAEPPPEAGIAGLVDAPRNAPPVRRRRGELDVPIWLIEELARARRDFAGLDVEGSASVVRGRKE